MSSTWTVVVALAVVAVAGAIKLDDRYEQGDTNKRAQAITGGSVDRGRTLFMQKGCGGCHALTGVPQAHGLVGPPLDGVGERAMIAGALANNPDNLERWIAHPQGVVPGNAMPDLPMTEQDSRDLAAFLYSRP
jgi:cytochrome c1